MLAALSLHWGKPIALVRRETSAREFAFWRRYAATHPLTLESMHHVPIAILCSLVANAMRAKNTKPSSALDFLPYRKKAKQEESEPFQFIGNVKVARPPGDGVL